jgi:hypothetical protein
VALRGVEKSVNLRAMGNDSEKARQQAIWNEDSIFFGITFGKYFETPVIVSSIRH